MLGQQHDNMRRTLCDMATTAGRITKEKPLHVFDQCGGDLLLLLDPGHSIVADVRVISEYVDALAETAFRHAAKLAEHQNRQRYEPACQQLGVGFLPLAKESDSVFGKDRQTFIGHCNKRSYMVHPSPVPPGQRPRLPFPSDLCATGEDRREQFKGTCRARLRGSLVDLSDFVHLQPL